MKKLSSQDIEDMLNDYTSGESVALLSRGFNVSKGTIYYHIKINSKRGIIAEPKSYLDHIRNQIFALEEKIASGHFREDQLPYARGEIRRLKHWLKVDRSRLPSDPFVLQ